MEHADYQLTSKGLVISTRSYAGDLFISEDLRSRFGEKTLNEVSDYHPVADTNFHRDTDGWTRSVGIGVCGGLT